MKNVLACLIAVFLVSGNAGASQADEGFIMTAGGLSYKDLRVGSGPAAQPGDIAVVHLVGWIDDDGPRGKPIYDSRTQEQRPVSFVVGSDKVMRGWSEGVTGMRARGTRLVRIPPQLGYGDKGVENLVPPRAQLLFTLELLEVRPPANRE